MFLNKYYYLIILFLSNVATPIRASEDIQTAVETLINSSVKSANLPCDDFYAFACGHYNDHHDSSLYNDIISYVDHQFNSALWNLFETLNRQNRLPTSKHSQTFVEKAQIYLKACQQEKKRNLTKYFEEVKPGLQTNWPILLDREGDSNQTFVWPGGADFDVWSLLGRLQSYGLNDVLIYQEILVGRQGELSIMMAPAVINEKNTLPDVKVLHVLLMQMGIKNPARIINQLKKTHKTLKSILNNLAENKEKNLELTFGDLEIFYPKLNLSSFLSELMDRQLPADTFVLLRNPSYFKYLNDNLWSAFEKQHLTNYLMAKFLYFLAFDGAADFKHTACIKDLRNKFDLAVNFLYDKHIFAQQSVSVKQDLQDMFQAETEMLANYFKSNYLQSTSAQIETLLHKLANVRLNIGNLPQAASFGSIADYYAKLPPLEDSNYYKNHLNLLKLRTAKSLVHASSQTHFIVTDNKLGSTSGAFYVPGQNMIVLPFASLMQPLYDLSYHNLTKFSLLGFILAHELAHAFDTHGLNFDHTGQFSSSLNGVLKNMNFQKSLKCLQSQLATASVDELVADNVAIQIIKKILSSQLKSPQPIWKRNLFLHVAQIFCNKNNLKYVDHDSDGERLNQMAKNLPGFAEAFECPLESKMNSKDKCRIY